MNTSDFYRETLAANKTAEVTLQKAESALDFAWETPGEPDAYNAYKEACAALKAAEAATHAAWVACLQEK